MANFTKNAIFLVFLLFFGAKLIAQPANDACVNATNIPNVSNFCSANGAGTTVNATDDLAVGGFGAASCWGAGAINDVWFSFTATATDVTITINGNQGSPAGGSLNRPQVALYSGTCGGTINELVCGSAPAGQNIIQIYKGGLTVGQIYLVRVDGVGANKGTFQYCINNYFPVPSPSGDCPTAVVLCDKNNFNVPSVSGAGNNASEMNGAACFNYDPFTGNVETSSTWYVFTFATNGTFTFVINPTNPGDDLDFALYRLPNGVGNCTGKVTTRCMASSCTGPTGLNSSSGDTEEPPDCLFGQDNFVAQVNVTAGQTYALAINNFTSTGNGFNISFGGTAQFQGPVAIINDNDADDQICIGQSITYTDGSTAPPTGTLTNWTWNFGLDATPATSTAQNPPSVSYSTPGVKTVTLTVKSDRGCLVTSTKQITVGNLPVSVSIAANQNNVCTGTNITFTATPTNPGSTPAYQWYLNGNPVGSNSTTYSNSTLNNGDQVKVVLTTSGSCVTGSPATSNTVVMTINPKPNVTVNSPTICAGNTTNLAANGATTYTWTGGLPNAANVTTPVLNSTTTYTVTGTTAGCSNTATATVTVNPKPNVTVNSPGICAGNTANLTANGATTYTWTGGLPNGANVTTPVLNSTTTYTVTGTDVNGCSNTAVATVTVNALPNVTVNSPTICAGQTANLTANGATTYTWTGGLPNGANVTTPVLNSTTTYTVTGSNGGCSSTATSTVTVNPKPTVTVNSPTICAGQAANLTANGASTYTWTGGLPNGANVTTPVLNSTTTYTVTGTAANGCSNTATSTVTVNPKPNVTVNSPSICTGTTANLTANGATSYTWTGGLPNTANVTTPVLTTTTTYTVTGTDANGCTNTATSIVTVNPKPNVTVNSPSICTGTSANLTANGASTYTWTGGLPNGANVTTPVLTSTTSYTVTGTDANGCVNTATSTVTVNPKPNVTVNSPTICAGQSANLTANGASTYTWTGGLPGGSNVTTPVLNSTTTYTVTGTDANGCKNTATSVVTVNPKPNVTVNSPSICTGNTANLTANGASAYTWTGGLPNGANVTTPALTSTTQYTVTGTDANGCSNTATSTVTVNPKPNVTVNSPSICTGTSANLTAAGASTYTWTGGLPNGANVTTPVLTTTTSYTVTGTDANGCINTATATVTVNPLPTVTVNSPTICAGQTAALSANGAVSYSWTGGLPNGANVTTPVLNSTSTYTVTGTDVNGCKNTATSTVTVNQKPVVTVNSPAICAGQAANLTANGASTYTWTGGLPNGANVTTPVLNSTTTYTVTGTDGNGCTNTATATVTVNQKPNVTVNSPSICEGTSATLTANGASAYTWTGGLPNSSTVNTPVLFSTTSYTVTGTDVNGCVNTATSTVTVTPKPNVTVNSPTICAGQTANLTANGATTYTWTGGLPNGANVTTPVLNATTSYTVTGTTSGCSNTAVATVTVNQNPAVTVNSPSVCPGTTASLTANGASTYTWTGGLPDGASVTTPPLNSNTTYTVTGTDVNGCTNTATASVSILPRPAVTVNSPEICEGKIAGLSANGAITYTWTGGLPNGANVTTPVLNSTTTYTVTGTDANGCTNTATSTVTVNPNKTTDLDQSICQGESYTVGPQSFSAAGNYTVHLQSSKGCDSTVNLNLTVNPVKTTNVSQTICEGQSVTIGGQDFPDAGTYSVKLQTSKGCDSTVILKLTVNPLLDVAATVVASKNDNCGDERVTFTATPTNGGTTPQYQWYLNGNPVGTNSNTYVNDTLKDGDNVWVGLTSSETCIKINPAFSMPIIMKVYNLDYIKPVISYCSGETRTLDLSISGSNNYTITWKNSDGTVTTTSNTGQIDISNTASGYVDFNIQYGPTCFKQDSVNIHVDSNPDVTLTAAEDSVKYGNEVQLHGTVNNSNYDYSWTPSNILLDSNTLSPIATLNATTLFSLLVIDEKGCSTEKSVLVNLIDECDDDFVFVPTGFSPNRDGVNDCFGVLYAPPMTEYKMVIFDRWGEKIFESEDISYCWDGKYKNSDALMDTYTYLIGFRCYNGKFITKKGAITLVR